MLNKNSEKTDGFSDFLPFVRPEISEEAIAEIVDCLRSGWVCSGPRVGIFEQNLRDYLNEKCVLSFTSGTAALFLALKSLNLQPGDEVITSSLTFVATANAIMEAGGLPRFVDIDASYNMDIKKVQAAITPRTKAIVPVHFAGLPVDLDPLYELAQRHGVRVIEDAAHALGASYKGRKIGSFGDMQMFSFQGTKNVSSIEGGALVIRDDATAQRLSHLRFHGIDRDAWNRFTKKGTQHYDVQEPGYKFNLPDVNAALGIDQLKRLDKNVAIRQKMADIYFELLESCPYVTLPQLPGYEHQHAWHIFPVLINEEVLGMSRDNFMAQMKEYNIGTGFHYQPVHLFSFYRNKVGYKEGSLPLTEDVGKRIVSLPFFIGLTRGDQERIVTVMKKMIK